MSITWNGVSSDTIGVIVERIPNRYVPTRRFSPQQVAGRNGNILLVDKAFPNVEQEYEVYLSAESQGLPSVARACAEWLMGPDGYCRLTDSYDTTVYREAFLMGGFDIENILNKFGRCTITFSCKPQKYLLTGDTPISIPAGSTTTYTGSSVQFDGITSASITSLSTTITPAQDLHGYANPWPGGGGKNLVDMSSVTREYFIRAGNASADSPLGTPVHNASWSCSDYIAVESSTQYTQTLPGYNAAGAAGLVFFSDKSVASAISGVPATTQGSATYTFTTPSNCHYVRISWQTGNEGSGSYPYPQLEKGAKTSYAPYSNICPISGLTGLSVYRTGKNLVDPSKKVATSTTTEKWYNDGTGFLLHGGQTYALSSNISTDATYFVYFYDMGGTQLAYGKWATTYTPSADTYVYFQYYESGGAHLADAELQLELGSATTYEPYNGNTYSVDWSTQAGTVYSGTVDVVTGVLTVDMVNIPSYNGETINEPWLSSMDAYAAGTTPTIGAQVVYTLATPLTYQLSAQEIGVLTGTNYVWLSDGDVSLTVTTPLGGIVTNPTPFDARPMLEVSGVGEITINGKSIQILESVSDFQIDCEAMEAEDNSKIYCMEFPELSGGENVIVGDGSVTSLTVTPRWWTL